MLSRKQWLWLADHHAGVRRACGVSLICSVVIYAGLLLNVMMQKGKVPTTDSSTVARSKAGCVKAHPAPDPYYLGPEPQVEGDVPVRYDEMNILRLESYRTEIFDVRVLDDDPKCFGALLVDELTESKPFMIYLYDKEKNKPVYRIEQLR
jgi:hypothetical protein